MNNNRDLSLKQPLEKAIDMLWLNVMDINILITSITGRETESQGQRYSSLPGS